MPFCSQRDAQTVWPPQPLGPSLLKRTFDEAGDFVAMHAAEGWLRTRGFSIGPLQGDYPRGLLLGSRLIAKWGGLTIPNRRALHGVLTGDFRNGQVTVQLFATAPAEAIEAFQREAIDA